MHGLRALRPHALDSSKILPGTAIEQIFTSGPGTARASKRNEDAGKSSLGGKHGYETPGSNDSARNFCRRSIFTDAKLGRAAGTNRRRAGCIGLRGY